MNQPHTKRGTLRVYFLRHGETDWNLRGLYQGHTDVSLNERGRRQARLVAAKLRGVIYDNVYTSDLRRARETAQIIMPQIGVEAATPLGGLRELNFGAWEGLSFAEVELNYPKECQRIFTEPLVFQPTAGETVTAMNSRVVKAWKRILWDNHRSGTIMIVTHDGPIRALWGHWLGGKGTALWNIPFPHCGMGFVSFDVPGGYPQIFVPRIL